MPILILLVGLVILVLFWVMKPIVELVWTIALAIGPIASVLLVLFLAVVGKCLSASPSDGQNNNSQNK